MYARVKRQLRPSGPDVIRKPWFVVANRSEARIFEGPIGEAALIEKLIHAQGRALNQELKEGKPGRSFSSWQGSRSRHSMGSELDPHEQQGHVFAAIVAAKLKHGRTKNLTEAITLVAEPGFLGLLLAKLDSPTKRIIKESIPKDLANLSDHEAKLFIANAAAT